MSTLPTKNDRQMEQATEVFSGLAFVEECDRIEDFKWLETVEANGETAAYRGHKIAVLNKTIVGFGDNGVELRDAVCREYNVPAHRPVISYVCGEND